MHGMRVRVTEHEPTLLAEQLDHRISEGIPDPRRERVFKNARNIRRVIETGTNHKLHEEYEYPVIKIQDIDGSEHVFDYALVDLSDTKPELSVKMIHDETASNVISRITTFDAYGINEKKITNKFGNEQNVHSIYLRDLDGEDVILCPHKYRGFIVTYPDGSVGHLGSLDRHSRTIQRQIDSGDTLEHPHHSDAGTFTVEADGKSYTGVRNVTRLSLDSTQLHTNIGNVIDVEDITGVSGPLYTMTVRHADTFGHGMTTTGVQNAMGVYRTSEDSINHTDKELLLIVGHPHSGHVYKKPATHRIAAIEDIEGVFVKRPDGTVITDIDEIPYIGE